MEKGIINLVSSILMRRQNNKVTLKVQAFVTIFYKRMHTFSTAFWALGMEML
jgi:hypothetical protein